MRTSVLLQLLLIAVLAAIAALLISRSVRTGELRVSFLDIGQGDAIFIEGPTGTQALVDGGPGAALLRALPHVMPIADRSIDVIVATHPDADHIGGLVDLLPRYSVGTIVQSSVLGSTPMWETFEREARAETPRLVDARRGDVLDLGGGAYLEILFPDRNVAHLETNTGCVVTRLVYGRTAFMLPCDTTAAVEEYLVWLDGEQLHADVLKAGHHGSKTSSAPLFVGTVAPSYAVISRGCGNSYGHPHQQTLDTFARFGVPIEDTCEEGTISFSSDGASVRRIK